MFRAANPGAPRVGVADLSRPKGGVFDRRYGGDGHASHQNGLDIDILYPRKDGTETRRVTILPEWWDLLAPSTVSAGERRATPGPSGAIRATACGEASIPTALIRTIKR